MLKMYKIAAQEHGVKLNVRNIMNQKKRNVESAKVELFNRVENPDYKLPPIKYPSLHPKERPFESYLDEIQFDKFIRRREKDLAKRRLNTAEENYKSVAKDYPASKEHMNIHFADSSLPDPSCNKEVHSAARTFQNSSAMLKKMEHNYSKNIKNSARKARGIDNLNKSSPTRKSAITEIMVRHEQRTNV